MQAWQDRRDFENEPQFGNWYSQTVNMVEIDKFDRPGHPNPTKLFKNLSTGKFLIVINAGEETVTRGWSTVTNVTGSGFETYDDGPVAFRRWLELIPEG